MPNPLDQRYPFVYHDKNNWCRVGVSFSMRTDFIRIDMLLENKPGGRWQVVDMTPDEAEQFALRILERVSVARQSIADL